MKKILPIFLTVILMFFSQSCGLMKMYNMTNCDFSFQRITGISWAGIDFMKNGFDYILYYGNDKVGDGVSTNKNKIVVPAKGGTTTIPMSFRVDLADLVDIKHPVQSGEKMVNIISDISKMGDGNTPFVVKLRPHFRIGNNIVNGPYFTIRDN